MNTKRLILTLLLIAMLSVIFLEAFDVIGGCYPTWRVTFYGYKAHGKILSKQYITRTLDIQAPADQVSWIALRTARHLWFRSHRHWEIVSIVPVP